MHRARHRLAGQRSRINHGIAGADDRIDGNFLPGPDDEDITDLHIIGVHAFHCSVRTLHVRVFRRDFHQLRDRLSGTTDGEVLEPLAYLIEHHDRNRLGIFACHESTDRGDKHQEGLIKRLPVFDAEQCLPHNVPSAYKIRNEVYEEAQPGIFKNKRHNAGFVEDQNRKVKNHRQENAFAFFFQFVCHIQALFPLILQVCVFLSCL